MAIVYVITEVEPTEEFFWYRPDDGGNGGCAEFAKIQNLESGCIPQKGQKITLIEPNDRGQYIILIS